MLTQKEGLSVDIITHCIEDYVDYARKHQHDVKSVLSDLVLYTIGYPHLGMLLNNSQHSKVVCLKEVCDSTDETIKAHLFESIKQTCFKYARHDNLSEINYRYHSAASILSCFVKEFNQQSPEEMWYDFNLQKLEGIPTHTLGALYFFIKKFNPNLKFSGSINEADQVIIDLGTLLNSRVEKVQIQFSCHDLGEMGSGARRLVLAAARHAISLSLKGGALHLWTSDDWKHIYNALKSNQGLTELNLAQCNLDKVCQDSYKFSLLLDLIQLPHLKQINMKQNNLSRLSKEQSKLFLDGIKHGKAEVILNQKVNSSLFPLKNKDETETLKEKELELEEFLKYN